MCFQKRFDILFKESNLSQEEFGKILAVTKNQIFNWRSGSGEPDTKMLVGIAKKCNVSVEWLLGSSTLRTSHTWVDVFGRREIRCGIVKCGCLHTKIFCFTCIIRFSF